MKKSKKGLSLRMRLTLITSLLLTIFCAMFTAFSIYNANHSILVAVQTEPAQTIGSIPAQELTPSSETRVGENALPLKDTQANTVDFFRISVCFMLAAIVAGSLVMYFISGIILTPLRKLSETVSTIDRNALHTRVTEFHAGDELNTLSDSFNSMLERLDLAFAREKRFSVDAAHELKTPLTIMKTTIDVLGVDAPLESDEKLAEYKEALAVVNVQTERMISLVNQLFRLSSMDGAMQKDAVNLELLAAEVQAELEPMCEAAEILVSTELESCTMQGNALLLKHCMLNLVQNSIKYSEKGSKIELLVKQEAENAVVEIRDQGIGIPKEQRSHIFEPFYRVDQSRSRAVGGAGLGLAMVKEIVNLHGGSIHCFSNKPQGMVFKLLFPL